MPSEEDFFLNADDETLVRPEPRAFAPDQMVTCEQCLRANPPTRSTCLYCGVALPLTEQSASLRKPALRPLEKWEQGFNSILLPRRAANLSADDHEQIATLLRLTAVDVRRIAESVEPLPLARAADAQEAALIESSLRELGVSVVTVSDEEFALEPYPPKRLRTLEFAEDALIATPAGSNEILSVAWDDIELLVLGRIIVRQIEVEERRGRRAENEIVETRELSADDAVLDIYSPTQRGNWRIVAGSFDFSCLGAKKNLLVAQNFATLLDELRSRAGHAEYDDSYARVRNALNAVWPLEQQTESRGWKRARPGRVSTEAVTTSNNERQFTRYSRLRRYLRLRRTDVET